MAVIVKSGLNGDKLFLRTLRPCESMYLKPLNCPWPGLNPEKCMISALIKVKVYSGVSCKVLFNHDQS